MQKTLTVKGKETIQMCSLLDSSGLWYMLLYLAPYGFTNQVMAMELSIKNIFLLFLKKKWSLALSADKRDLRRDQDNRNKNKAVSVIHLNKVKAKGRKLLK